MLSREMWNDGLEPVVEKDPGFMPRWICFGGGGGKKPPPPPPPPPPPTKSDAEVEGAASEERKRRSLQQGRASTILTGPEGITTPATGAKTLLGQ